MQRLEVSGAVRLIYGSLGVKLATVSFSRQTDACVADRRLQDVTFVTKPHRTHWRHSFRFTPRLFHSTFKTEVRNAVNSSINPVSLPLVRDGKVSCLTSHSIYVLTFYWLEQRRKLPCIHCCTNSGRGLLFGGSKASLVCPSSKGNIWMKMSVERWWNDTDRWKQKYWEKNII